MVWYDTKDSCLRTEKSLGQKAVIKGPVWLDREFRSCTEVRECISSNSAGLQNDQSSEEMLWQNKKIEALHKKLMRKPLEEFDRKLGSRTWYWDRIQNTWNFTGKFSCENKGYRPCLKLRNQCCVQQYHPPELGKRAECLRVLGMQMGLVCADPV